MWRVGRPGNLCRLAYGIWFDKRLVLRPVDSGDIDPFLDHLPKGAAKSNNENQLTTLHNRVTVPYLNSLNRSTVSTVFSIT